MVLPFEPDSFAIEKYEEMFDQECSEIKTIKCED